jgi:hypothetical protein
MNGCPERRRWHREFDNWYDDEGDEGNDTCKKGPPFAEALSRLKWTPLSRPFFARNKLMPGGVLGLSFGGG